MSDWDMSKGISAEAHFWPKGEPQDPGSVITRLTAEVARLQGELSLTQQRGIDLWRWARWLSEDRCPQQDFNGECVLLNQEIAAREQAEGEIQEAQRGEKQRDVYSWAIWLSLGHTREEAEQAGVGPRDLPICEEIEGLRETLRTTEGELQAAQANGMHWLTFKKLARERGFRAPYWTDLFKRLDDNDASLEALARAAAGVMPPMTPTVDPWPILSRFEALAEALALPAAREVLSREKKGWPGHCQNCGAVLDPPDRTDCSVCHASDEDET